MALTQLAQRGRPEDGWRAPPSKRVRWYDPLILAAAGPERSGREFLQAIIDRRLPPPPIATLVGTELAAIGEGEAVFRCTPDESTYNPIVMVHGGLLCTLLDSAAGCAVQTLLPAGDGTIELKVSFLKPRQANSGQIEVHGHAVRVGSRVAFAEAHARDESLDDRQYGAVDEPNPQVLVSSHQLSGARMVRRGKVFDVQLATRDCVQKSRELVCSQLPGEQIVELNQYRCGDHPPLGFRRKQRGAPLVVLVVGVDRSDQWPRVEDQRNGSGSNSSRLARSERSPRPERKAPISENAGCASPEPLPRAACSARLACSSVQLGASARTCSLAVMRKG